MRAYSEAMENDILRLTAGRFETCLCFGAKCEAKKESGSSSAGLLHLAGFLAAGMSHNARGFPIACEVKATCVVHVLCRSSRN